MTLAAPPAALRARAWDWPEGERERVRLFPSTISTSGPGPAAWPGVTSTSACPSTISTEWAGTPCQRPFARFRKTSESSVITRFVPSRNSMTADERG